MQHTDKTKECERREVGAQKTEEFLLDQETKEIYNIKAKNQFAALAEDHNRSIWVHLKKPITKTTEEVLPERERTAEQGWMTQEILDDMKNARISSTGKARNTGV